MWSERNTSARRSVVAEQCLSKQDDVRQVRAQPDRCVDLAAAVKQELANRQPGANMQVRVEGAEAASGELEGGENTSNRQSGE